MKTNAWLLVKIKLLLIVMLPFKVERSQTNYRRRRKMFVVIWASFHFSDCILDISLFSGSIPPYTRPEWWESGTVWTPAPASEASDGDTEGPEWENLILEGSSEFDVQGDLPSTLSRHTSCTEDVMSSRAGKVGNYGSFHIPEGEFHKVLRLDA